MIAKQEQMADSSTYGKANSWGHPAYIFVEKTAGRIDSRFTLPKWHLATLNNYKKKKSLSWSWFYVFVIVGTSEAM